MNFNVRVIQYPEVLDANKANQFYREIQHFIEIGVNIVLVDLKNVRLINSYSLMALVEAFRAVKNAGGKLCICSANEQAKILFELTGLEQVFEIFANLEEFTEIIVLTS